MTQAAIPVSPAQSDAEIRSGFIAGAFAYLLWGFFPLYLKLIAFADVREVLGMRIIWGIPAALAAVFLVSGWKRGLTEIGAALKPKMLATLTASAIFIFINWGLYVWLVLHHRVIESALAYFLAPLVAVAVGVMFFGERVGITQIVALVLAVIGVIVQGAAIGAPPWLALALCATWSVYAVIRKRAPVQAATGLLIETLALLPVAIGLVLWAASSAPLAFNQSWTHVILLALAGPATAFPLMLFGFSARRVSFTTLGLLQYIAPSLQFMTGIAFGEAFTPLRAASFALIWLGLALFTWDTLKRNRSRT